MPKIPIIAGIDPGTTSAYAILDINGNVIELYSSKDFGLNKIISQISRIGIPILVGTDKANAPDFIYQFAAKTGARVSSPKEDSRVEDKKEMTKSYNFDDSHQMDALASALMTYNSYSSLISRIKAYISENHKEQILNQLITLVVKEEIPIKDAARLIEKPKEEAEIVKKVIEQKSIQKKDYLRLYNDYKLLTNDLLLLRRQNKILADRNIRLENELNTKKSAETRNKGLNFKKIDSLFAYKENRLKEMDKKLREKEDEIQKTKHHTEEILEIISNLNHYYLLKKLKNLSIKEYEEKKIILNIEEGDFLLVDDPNIYSEKVTSSLKDKVKVILHNSKLARRTAEELNFEFIPAEGIKLISFKEFIFADKKAVDSKLNKKSVLNRIIDDYKKEREN